MGDKIRKLGEVTQDLEPLLMELVDHELQHGEILHLILGWLSIHAPESRENYIDGTVPVFYYGHKDHMEDINYDGIRKAGSKRKKN